AHLVAHPGQLGKSPKVLGVVLLPWIAAQIDEDMFLSRATMTEKPTDQPIGPAQWKQASHAGCPGGLVVCNDEQPALPVQVSKLGRSHFASSAAGLPEKPKGHAKGPARWSSPANASVRFPGHSHDGQVLVDRDGLTWQWRRP